MIELWEGWSKASGSLMGSWLLRHPQMGRQSQTDTGGERLTLPNMWEQGLLSHPPRWTQPPLRAGRRESIPSQGLQPWDALKLARSRLGCPCITELRRIGLLSAHEGVWARHTALWTGRWTRSQSPGLWKKTSVSSNAGQITSFDLSSQLTW